MGYKSNLTGVAVSDSATGPYRFIKAERPNKCFWPLNVLPINKTRKYNIHNEVYNAEHPVHPDSINMLGRDFAGGQIAQDMTIFVDDDEKAYQVYSSEEDHTIHISELSDDYLSHIGRYVRIFVGRFMEAPTIFKSKDTYYFIGSGCTGWMPNAARSASSKSIFGPWEELGNPCEGKGAELTFHSQSTYVLPVEGKKDAFIFMADRWTPKNAIDGRYVWLPIDIINGRPAIKWKKEWNLDYFDNTNK